MYDKAEPVLRDAIASFKRDEFKGKDISEIRRDLYSQLHSYFTGLGLTFRMPSPDSPATLERKEVEYVEVTPVKTAYPLDERFDIAIMDLNKGRDILEMAPTGEATSAYESFWRQPVNTAINVHLCESGKDPKKFFRVQENDLKKFEHYSDDSYVDPAFTGISILFCEDDIPVESINGHANGLETLTPGVHAWVVTPKGEFHLPVEAS